MSTAAPQASPVPKASHEIVADGGFEGGSPSGAWTESSSVFGSPLSPGTTGTAGGSGPRSGSWLAWFGGNGIDTDDAALSQAITVPKGAGPLLFSTEAPVCGSAGDVLEAQIDGTVVFQMTGTDATCGILGYTQRAVGVAPWADGGTHTLAFTSHVAGTPAADLLSFSTSNFLVDDVSIQAAPVGVPALSGAGVAALLSCAALVALRRRRRAARRT